MIELTLDEVAAAVGGELRGDAGPSVRAVGTDTRALPQDALFVALRGEHADGHRFVADAFGAGAVAAMVERAALADLGVSGPLVVVEDTWRAVGDLGGAVRDRVDPTVVAITGSVGKTTTKDLVRAALAPARTATAAAGSFNNELGVPLTLLSTTAATQVLVVEVGARGVGHVASLMPWVRPDVAVVTAVAAVHTELFGSLEDVARGKGELVEALDPSGIAVLNADDHRVWAMRSRTSARVLGYGHAPGADVRPRDVRVDERARPSAVVATPWGDVEVSLPVPGLHNLDNALAALAVAGACGVDLEVAAAGLADAALSRWRAELTDRADGLLVCNDAYNANPTATEAALRMLAALRRPGGRTVAVLGLMAELGPFEREGHERVGAAAGAGADLVVVVGHGAVEHYVPAARAAGAEVVTVASPAAAVDALRGRVGAGDVVLVKGSRSAGLEVVAAGLLEDDTPRDDDARPSPHDRADTPLRRPALEDDS